MKPLASLLQWLRPIRVGTITAAVTLLSLQPPAQWSTTTLSVGRWKAASTTLGDKVFVAGGVLGVPLTPPTDSVEVFTVSTGTWSPVQSLSVARHSLAATSVGSKALFAGGRGKYSGQVFDVVDIYDDSTGLWTTAKLSLPRYDLAATTVGSKAFFFGGFPVGNVVDIYDDSTGHWTTKTWSVSRSALTATSVGSKALFAGGIAGTYSDMVDIYDDSTGTWTTATLSAGRAGLTATTVGSKAIFAGGGAGYWESNVVDIYDDSTGIWTTASLSRGRRFLTSTTVGSKAMFAGGGTHGYGYAYKDVDIYDDATGLWSTEALPNARTYLTSTTVGCKALFIGGYTFTGMHDTADVYDHPTCTTFTFCSAKTTTACGPANISATGSPSATAANGFFIDAQPVRGCRAGLLLYSDRPVQPGAAFGGPGNGLLCLSGPGLRRAGPIDSGGTSPQQCDGIFSIDMSQFQTLNWTATGCNPPPGQNNPAGFLGNPGTTVNAQMWGRDSIPSGQVLSDGISWVVGP